MAATPTTAIATYQTGAVFDSVARLATAIKELSTKHHLVVPGGAIGGQLPLLHAAAVSFVFVDPEHETYAIPGGKLGVGKNALDRIAAAAGVRWDPHLCGRVDDRRSPYIVEYQAVGTVLQLDGTERMIHATKRIDLTADRNTDPEHWGTDAQEIARIAAKSERPRDPWPQIMQQRQHILSLAESKAKNRAVRSLGVRTSYTREELERGFAIIRLQFTGRSDDPEIEREVSLMVARRALAASSALYGGRGADRAELPATRDRHVPRLLPPEEDAPDEIIDAAEVPTHLPSASDASPPTTASVPPAESATPVATSAASPRPARDPLVPHGKGKPRGPASQLPAENLLRLADWLETKIASEQDARKAAYQRQDAADCRAWAAYKLGAEPDGSLVGDGAADDGVPF